MHFMDPSYIPLYLFSLSFFLFFFTFFPNFSFFKANEYKLRLDG